MREFKVKLSYYSLLPVVWLASLGNSLTSLYLNTNWRDYEIGITFLFYLLAIKYYLDELHPLKNSLSKILSLLLILISSLLTYSDPYFLDFTLLSIFLFFIGLYAMKKVALSKLAGVTVFVLLNIIISRILTAIMARFGIISPRDSSALLSSVSKILPTLGLAVKGTLQLFSIDFKPTSYPGLEIISSIFDALILGIGLIYIIRTAINKDLLTNNSRLNIKILIQAFFSALSLFVFAAYVFSDNGLTNSYRYLVILDYSICILLIFGSDKLKKRSRQLFAGLMCVAIILNFVNFVYQNKEVIPANTENYRLINILESANLTKGYASYWDSDINTYLSGGKIDFLPVTCVRGQSRPLRLLVDGSLFTKDSDRTFYIVDSHYISPQACDQQQVIEQFGLPEQTVKVGSQKILIYSYDLINKL